MRQNSVIFAALFLAFVVYITAKGKLGAYVALFYKGNAQGVTPGPTQNIATPFGSLPIPTLTVPGQGNIPIPPIQTPFAPGTM